MSFELLKTHPNSSRYDFCSNPLTMHQNDLLTANKLFDTKQYQDALTCYNSIIESGQPLAEAFYMRGRTKFMLKMEESQVLNDYRVAHELEPENAEYSFVVGKSLFRQKDFYEAINYFNKAINLDGSKPDYFAMKGQALNFLERSDEAMESYYSALKESPSHSVALAHAISILINQGNEKEALSLADKAIASNPDSSMAWALKGDVLTKKTPIQKDEARDCYERAIALDVNSLKAWVGKGTLLIDQPEKAIEAFDHALLLNSNHTFSKLQKGICLYKLGRFADAIPFISAAKSTHNEYYWILYCECLLNVGEVDLARREAKLMDNFFAGDPDWSKLKRKLTKGSGSSSENQIKLSPIEKEWVEVIDEFITSFVNKSKSRLAAIVIEWDDVDDESLQLQLAAVAPSDSSKERFKHYFAIGDESVILSEFTSVSSKIKTKKAFDNVLKAIFIATSQRLKPLLGGGPLVLTIQEHDSKVNFIGEVRIELVFACNCIQRTPSVALYLGWFF
jgi:tetratricopeptide (TPR) repeat protein